MNYEATKGCIIKALQKLNKSKEEIITILEQICNEEETLTEIQAQTIYFEFME